MTRYWLLWLLLNWPFWAQAQQIRQIGNQTYEVGVSPQEINFLRANSLNAGKQLQSNWCWAASIQMVLNYHGLQVSQLQLVEKLFGDSQLNQAATADQILMALKGWQIDINGNLRQVFAQEITYNDSRIITALSYKWPIIVGLHDENGVHAVVLTGAQYEVKPEGEIKLLQVILLDPWPPAPYVQKLSAAAFRQKCTALIKIMVIR